MNLKFFYPLSGLAAGIFISSELTSGLLLGSICISLSIFLWCGITFFSKNPSRAIKITKLHNVWIFLLFLGIGSLDYNVGTNPVVPYELEGKKANFQGIVQEVKYLADGDRYKVAINSLRDSIHSYDCERLHFLVKTDGYMASKGDKITFEAIPKKINPKVSKTDFDKRLFHQGINYYANVKSSNIIKIGEASTLTTFCNDFRNKLIIQLENSSLKRTTTEFLVSILLGDKTFLSSDVRQTLNSAGMAHILALSGMHVAIILSLLLWILFPLSLLGFSKLRKIFAIVLIWIYVLVTGASPSTVRAAIMATFLVGAYLLERKNSALNSLLAATLIILVFNPSGLWDIGLQLSFICVGAIIIFTDRLNPVEHHEHPVSYSVCNIILVTIITTACTWALVSYYFGCIPVAFLLTNIVLLPLLPLFIGLGILYILMLNIGVDPSVLAVPLDWFNTSFIEGARILSFSGEGAMAVKVPLWSAILWVTGFLGLGFVLYFQRNLNKKIGITFSVMTLCGALILISVPSNNQKSKLTFVHSFTKLEAHHLKDNNTVRLEFPRKSVSDMEYKDFKILAVDSRIHVDSFNNLNQNNDSKNHFLIVGSQADTYQIADLINKTDYTKIILHTSVGKNKKAELLSLVNETEIDKIYSLRENGSLEFEL